MWRKVLIASVFIFLIFISFLIIKNAVKEKPFKWVYSYNQYSKQPYDTKVFFNEIQKLFPSDKVEKVTTENFYELYYEPYQFDTLLIDSIHALFPYYPKDSIEYFGSNINFIALNDRFYTNPHSINSLLSVAIDGGHVQIHSHSVDFRLAQIFDLKYNSFNLFNEIDHERRDTLMTLIYNDLDTLQVRNPEQKSYILDYDTLGEVILQGDNGNIYGVKFKLGYGSISFYSVPHLFTNYDILNGDNTLLEKIISDLPNGDTYYNNNLLFNDGERSRDLLSFIHENQSLKWSFYLLLISVLVYLTLGLQRKLRPTPIISPPLNLNLSFLRTISDLHYDKKDYKFILNQKMIHLKESVRQRYSININEIDHIGIKKLSKRSGVSEVRIKDLFSLYALLIKKESIQEHEFINMCRLFQIFKNN